MTQLKTVMVSRLSEHARASALIPEMSPKEWLDFLKNVEEHGIRQPIDINREYQVLDGRHRLRAAKKLGIETLQVIQHDFTKNEEIEFVRDTAIERRSLTAVQKVDIILKTSEIVDSFREKAKENQRSAMKTAHESNPNNQGNSFASPEPKLFKAVNTSQEIGEMAGTSRATVNRMKRLSKERPDLYEEVVSGKTTASTAYEELPPKYNTSKRIEIPKPKQQTNQQPPQLPKEEIDRQMLEANVKTFLNHMEQLTGFFQRTENLEKVIAVAFERNEKAFSEFENEFERVVKLTQMEVI